MLIKCEFYKKINIFLYKITNMEILADERAPFWDKKHKQNRDFRYRLSDSGAAAASNDGKKDKKTAATVFSRRLHQSLITLSCFFRELAVY